jgi:hypothetical protein
MNEIERADFHTDFERALAFATRLHATQVRKQTDIPYISHLIGVAGLVLENGGVSALRERIRADFGETVLAIVAGCSSRGSPSAGVVAADRLEAGCRQRASTDGLAACPRREAAVLGEPRKLAGKSESWSLSGRQACEGFVNEQLVTDSG